MNWLIFSLAAWLLLGFELGMRRALELGNTSIAPSFVFSLLVLVALAASPVTIYSAAFFLGLLVDLLNPIVLADGKGDVVLLGPYTLGYLLSAQLMLLSRGMLMRRNPLTFGLLAGLGFAVVQVMVLSYLTIRGWFSEPVAMAAGSEVLRRLASAFYTGLLGMILALALLPLASYFGFANLQSRRFARRD